MAQELKEHLFVPHSELQEGDELTDAFTIAKSYYLKSEADKAIAEKDKVIAELKDKRQMHDFFWEGCGFAKREFKNTIAVREAFDKLEAENESLLQQNSELCQALQVMYGKDAYDKQKYKRCKAMAKWCGDRWADIATPYFQSVWYRKWELRWLNIAEKFKEAVKMEKEHYEKNNCRKGQAD